MRWALWGPGLWLTILLLTELLGPAQAMKYWLGSYSFVNRSTARPDVTRRCFDPSQHADGLAFTPTRVYPRVGGKVALVLMFTTMAHNPHHRIRFLLRGRSMHSRWHSWRIRLLQRSPYIFPIFVFQYHPDLNLTMMADWLGLEEGCEVAATAVTCRMFAALDSGYRVFSSLTSTRRGGRRFHLLMTLRNITLPSNYTRRNWADAPLLPNGAQMAYVAGTNFYATNMFDLRVLDYFDFFLKLDYDITFMNRLDGDVLAQIRHSASLFLHTGTAEEPDLVSAGVADCVAGFLGNETQRCGRPVAPLSIGQKYFEDKSLVYYSNFVAGWLGFFMSPEVRAFSAYWAAWPGGPWADRWAHRWTDQQFWSQALGLFHDGSRISNLTQWRSNGVFLHHK